MPSSKQTGTNTTSPSGNKKLLLYLIAATLLIIAVVVAFVVTLPADEPSASLDLSEQFSAEITIPPADEPSFEESEELSQPPVEQPPEEAPPAEEALTLVLSTLEEPWDDGEEKPEFLVATENLNGYNVISYEETETGAIATLRVFAPDLYALAKEIDATTSGLTQEELIAVINASIESASIIEQQVTLEFEKTDEGYLPILTAEFLDALYGGVFRLYDDMLTSNKEDNKQ